MSTSAADHKTLEAKCFCGAVHFTIELPVSKLPLSSYCCHCSICRSMTGAPCTFHTFPPAESPLKYIAPSNEDSMTSYVPEGATAYLKFCSTCGCHVGGLGIEEGDWCLSTSIFMDHGPENFQYTQNVFTLSAKDGGIAPFLSHLAGREVKTWNPPAEDPSSQPVEYNREVGDDGIERLRVRCHCGGVSFAICRPTQAILDDEFLAQYVSPLDKNKWMALLDMCNDCRLVDGAHVIGWMFVPASACEPPIPSDLKIGTSKTFSSSPGVLRSFCGVCGATVSYTTSERKTEDGRCVYDIATGILRAPEGVMAESWLTWRTRVSYVESGVQYDRAMGEAIRDGMEKWTLAKYGQVVKKEIP